MLANDAAAIHEFYQPQIDALAKRRNALQAAHLDFSGDPDRALTVQRTAELASDGIDGQPFIGSSTPGPGHKVSPATLQGLYSAVKPQVDKLVAEGNVADLQRLVEQERDDYERGIAKANEDLLEVESWVNLVGRVRQPPPPPAAPPAAPEEKPGSAPAP